MDDTLFDKIEDYLRGKLPKETAILFEREIEAISELKELVNIHRMELESIEFLVEQDLMEKIQKWEAEPATIPDKPLPKVRKWRWWLALCLLVTVLLTGIYYFKEPVLPAKEAPLKEEQPPVQEPDGIPNLPGVGAEKVPSVAEDKPRQTDGKTDKQVTPMPQTNEYLALMDEFYTEPDNLVANLRSPASNIPPTQLTRATQAYKNNRYKEVIALLRDLTPAEEPKQYDFARELLGHAYCKAKQFPAASAVFQSIADRDLMANINDRAEWYLVLSLLPNYEKEKKRINGLLNKMANPAKEHGFVTSAQELQQKLSTVKN